MDVNMRLICIFWFKLFRQKKPNFVCVFDLKKPSALKNIPNFKICKNPSTKTAKFQNLQKSKIINPVLGVHYSG